jgi:hypothetical protein
VSERLHTLREWKCVYSNCELFKTDAAQRTAPHMRNHIAVPEEAHDFRCFHVVGLGTMGLVLLSMYNEMGTGTTNYPPQAYAICYLVLDLNHSERLSGTWATIEAVSDRHCKDIFISEDLPSRSPTWSCGCDW